MALVITETISHDLTPTGYYNGKYGYTRKLVCVRICTRLVVYAEKHYEVAQVNNEDTDNENEMNSQEIPLEDMAEEEAQQRRQQKIGQHPGGGTILFKLW